MCTLCSRIAPIASECVLGHDAPRDPMAIILDDAGGTGSTANAAGTASGAGSIDEMAAYLTDGYWESVGFAGFAFADGDITVNLSGLTADGRQLARWAMEAWEMVADLTFREVSGTGEIRFQDHGAGAYGGPESVINGVNSQSVVNVSETWLDIYGTGIDSYSFSIYIHEIGHALGLGHQGPYDGSGVYGTHEIFENDNTQLTVMSYFDPTDNTTVDADFDQVITPMLVDIVAIQTLYGAPGSGGATAGATTYGAGSDLDNYLGTWFDILAGAPAPADFLTEGEDLAFTIYDRGGTDTLDLGFSRADNDVSLVAGTFSDIEGGRGNMGIARGTVLENAILGAGADRVRGNDAGNEISGGGGSDRISGAGGDDDLSGGAGGDSLYGGDGVDVLRGGNGNDYMIGNRHDDRLYGGNGADRVSGGWGNDAVHGNGGDDELHGNRGADRLYGGDGADTLFGGDGNDYMIGNRDDDRLFGGNGADRVSGGWGNDKVHGNGGDDKVYGNRGADRLFGGDGVDTLRGGNHNDYLTGNRHDDRVFGGNGHDTVSGGWGNDIVHGNNGDDRVYGSRGADRLFGGDGADTLRGGNGNDRLHGGAGADTFVFEKGRDIVLDFNLGAGDGLHLYGYLLGDGVDTGREVVNTYGRVSEGDAVLDFGDGDTVRLNNVTHLGALADTIDII